MLEQLQENGQMPSFLAESQQRRGKWAHLTEGLDDYQRLCLETLFENTKRWIMNEETNTGNVGTFTTYAFPLIRRVMPNLFANELVSIQPIPMPTAKIFYLDFKYSDEFTGTTSAGDRIDLQDNFNPYYSGGTVRGDLIAGVGDTGTSHNLTYFPVVVDSELLYLNGELLTQVSSSASDGEYEIDYDTGDITTGDSLSSSDTLVAYYQVRPGEGQKPRELELDMSDDSVEAETQKLMAKWTIEAQQDLMAYHGLSVENEVMNVVGNQLIRETDRKIVGDLWDAATSAGGAGSVSWAKTIAPDYNGSQREWRMTLYDAIIDANARIYDERMVNANWIVAGSNAATELEKLEGFTEVHRDWAVTGMGMERFGVLKNRFNVYKDPWAPADKMLLGYKGGNMFETGYVYSPYQPLFVTPPIIDPEDFKPRRGMMTRYARKLVDASFYAEVNITS